MISDKSKSAVVSLGVPLIILLLSVSFVILGGGFEADPDYPYLLNGLNILHLQSPGHADHPGTPVQLLAGAVIGLTWLVRWLAQGQVPLDEDVLRHPNLYLTCIHVVLALLTAAALAFFGLQLRRWAGSILVAIVGQITVLMSLPVLISLPRVTPEPLLITLTVVLVGLLAPVISQASFPRQRLRYPLLIGATLGACFATKMTAAPLILTVALLRGVRMQILAIVTMVATTILLTLPVVALYGPLLRWALSLATHGGSHGEGSVGMPPLSNVLANLKLLFESFPGAFVTIAICAIMLMWRQRLVHADRGPPVRFFVVCALLIFIQLIAVAKNYSLRYSVPAVAIVALANAGAVYTVAIAQRVRGAWFTVAIFVLLSLGTWHAAHAVWGWYGTSYAASKERESLMTEAASSGCAMVPYYGARSQEYNLYFGNKLAKEAYTRRLATIYPDFLTYNGKQFEDFVEVYDTARAAKWLASRKCVYLFGLPMARFDNFGISSDELTLISRSQGNLGEELAIYQLSSKMSGQ